MADKLLQLVGNARYDVTRYPSHVAYVTDTGNKTSFKRLVDSRAISRCKKARQYLSAIVLTFFIPSGVLLYKTPDVCHITDVIYDTVTDKDILEVSEYHYDYCRQHIRGTICFAAAAVLLGPMLNVIMTIILRISLCCTTKLYKLYAGAILRVFDSAAPYVLAVLFASNTKPVEHQLSSFWEVWKRLSYTPYMIMLWTFGVLAVIFIWCGQHVEFTGVLALFLWQTYFPIMADIFKGDVVVREVATQELQRRTLQMSCIAKEYKEQKGYSDVWWRLFLNFDAVFTCSSAELDLIVRYFEVSHQGIDGQKWPIWWHDELCLSENNQLSALYLDDLNYLVTPECLMPNGSSGRRDNGAQQLVEKLDNEDVAEAFLQDLLARLEKLRAEDPART